MEIQSGEYNAKDVYRVYNARMVYKDIAEQYRKYADGLPTILFAANKALSKKMVAELNKEGIPAAHIDDATPHHERDEIIKKLESGEIKIICNINVLIAGVDIPRVSCIILCRPTLSRTVHVQQCGRGSRPYPSKDHFIILDMAGNTDRFGMLEWQPTGELEPEDDEKKDKNGPKERKPVECPECSHVFMPKRGSAVICPECDWAKEPEPAEPEDIRVVNHSLFLEELDRNRELMRKVREIATANHIAGLAPGFLFFKVKELCGYELAQKICPKERKEEFYTMYSDYRPDMTSL